MIFILLPCENIFIPVHEENKIWKTTSLICFILKMLCLSQNKHLYSLTLTVILKNILFGFFFIYLDKMRYLYHYPHKIFLNFCFNFILLFQQQNDWLVNSSGFLLPYMDVIILFSHDGRLVSIICMTNSVFSSTQCNYFMMAGRPKPSNRKIR